MQRRTRSLDPLTRQSARHNVSQARQILQDLESVCGAVVSILSKQLHEQFISKLSAVLTPTEGGGGKRQNDLY